MKMYHLVLRTILFLVVVSLFSACEKTQNTPLNKPTPPTISVENIATFPSYSIHILEREYLHQKTMEGQRVATLTLSEYIEARLLELYPDIAFEGMLDYYSDLYEQYEAEYQLYLQEEALYEASIGIEPQPVDEYVPFTTLEAEIELTGMTQEEIDLFLALEEIAQSDPPVSIEVLDSLLNAEGERLSQPIFHFGAVPFAVGFMPQHAFRILQSKNRAESRTTQYYDGNYGSGQKGDAFRHIFVSMHLRRYIGRSSANFVTILYEIKGIIEGTNTPANMHMDLHNNYIGFHSKYSHFRGHWAWDKYNWGNWARNVRDFVNNSSNGVKFIQILTL